MTADRSAPAVDDADLVNGPEDVLGDWDEVEWRRVEQDVRRLRQRIFTASQAGDLKRVRNLQELMLRSPANTLVSVRRVTERNAGRATAGIDGEVALTLRPRRHWRWKFTAEIRPGRPVRSSGYTSRRRMGNSVRSASRCCATGPCKPQTSSSRHKISVETHAAVTW